MSDTESIDEADGARPYSPSGMYFADGSPHKGEVFENEAGKAFGETYEGCSRCGGSGRWSKNRRKACIACDGEGEKFIQARLYTPAELDAADRRRKKAADTRVARQAEREANIAAKHQAFVEANPELWARALASEDKFVQRLVIASQTWGGLTDAQLKALPEALDRLANERAFYANSVPVGTPGERMDIVVTCRAKSSFLSKKFKGRGMQEVHLTSMADDEGRAFVSITSAFTLDVGDKVLLRGTVKGHDERPGWPRTILNRVAVLEVISTLASRQEAEAAEQVREEEWEHASAPSM
ncbi:hypothetical protein [Bosea sp. RAC05]|uniref:hypothetical protein n=1 Tax=Bosea sp. RAC05 TaxID=1842539 RepID=UPI000855551D|nr:hypothetical protein [Bosea sp. RAC05]AOG03161.1 hypothetical protein BSY19_4801 [Bosea sp. RAC05]